MRENFKYYLTNIALQKNKKKYTAGTSNSYVSHINKIGEKLNKKIWFEDLEELNKIKTDDFEPNLINAFNLFKEFIQHYCEDGNFNIYKKIEKKSKNESYLQELILDNLKELFPKFKLYKSYYRLTSGEIIDIILESSSNNKHFKIIELKSTKLTRNHINQLIGYGNEFSKKIKDSNIELCLIGNYYNKDLEEFINNNYKDQVKLELKSFKISFNQ